MSDFLNLNNFFRIVGFFLIFVWSLYRFFGGLVDFDHSELVDVKDGGEPFKNDKKLEIESGTRSKIECCEA